jgi:hypothetical protein
LADVYLQTLNKSYLKIKNIMKKITLFIAFLAFVLIANAQVLLDETFNYAGTSLTTEPTWTTSPNTGAVGTIGNLSTDPLSYGDANGMYALSGVGKLVTSDYTSGGSDYKTVKAITPTSSGVIYMSLLFKPGVAQAQSQCEIMCLSVAGGNGPKVLIGKGVTTTTNFRFATTRASSSNADYKWASTEYSDINQTFLLVVKYDWDKKTASLFVNPVIASSAEPTADIFDNDGGPGLKVITAPIDGFRFRCNGSSAARFQVSGVRISTSWAAAVGKQVAELAIPAVSAASAIANSGFNANWTPVANAIGYEVSVYASGLLVKTVSVTGQATATAAITGLNSGTAYTYKVSAVADKITFANSQLSADSPAVTTLGLQTPATGVASDITSSSFTANWTSVANATGYDVIVYQNTTLLKTVSVSGQATSSTSITGLIMGTTYSYKVVAKGSVDSTPSVASTCNTTATNVNSISTDFSQVAVWGNPIPTPSTNLPANGNYPIWKSNGFSFEKALIYGGSTTGVNGETHTNAISFDKLITAAVVFPTVNSVAQVEIHANSGSDAKSIVLEELAADGTTWTLINTYNTNKLEATYIENISRSTPTTFRLRNNVTSSMNVSQIIVRPTLPTTTALPSPTGIGAATGLAAGAFTASWSPVANATGYIVSVWNYGRPTSKNFTVTGQTTNTYNVIGLDSASLCTYKVAAIGDGIVYSNSLLSLPSASFAITAGLMAVENPSVSSFISTYGKTIVASEIGYFEVYNLQGVRVLQARYADKLNTNLINGLYIVRHTNISGKKMVQKIVIQ